MAQETNNNLNRGHDETTEPEPTRTSTTEIPLDAYHVKSDEEVDLKLNRSQESQRLSRSPTASTTDSQRHLRRPRSKHQAHFSSAFHRPNTTRTNSQKNLARFQKLALATGNEGASAARAGGTQSGTATPSRRDHARKVSAPIAALALAATNSTVFPGPKGDVSGDNVTASGRTRGSGTATPTTLSHPQSRPPIRRNLSSPVFLQNHSRRGSNSGFQKTSNFGPNAGATRAKSKLAFALTSHNSDDGGGQEDEWEDQSSPYSQSGTTTPDREHQDNQLPGDDAKQTQHPPVKTEKFKLPKPPPSPPPSLQPRLHLREGEPSSSSIPMPATNRLSFAPLPSKTDFDDSDSKKAFKMNQYPRASLTAGQSNHFNSADAEVSRFLYNGASSGSGNTISHGAPVCSPPPTTSSGHDNQTTENPPRNPSRPSDTRKPPAESSEMTANSSTAFSPSSCITGGGHDMIYRVSTLASRTQQRLWLQRDAVSSSNNTLTNTRAGKPHDSHCENLEDDSLSSSGLDSAFIKLRDIDMVASEVFNQEDVTTSIQEYVSNRPDARDNILYKRYRAVFSVVHRFRNPAMDSFKRLSLSYSLHSRPATGENEARLLGQKFRGRDDAVFAQRPATSSSMYPSMRMSPSRPQLKHSHSQLRPLSATSREVPYDFSELVPSPFARLAEAYNQDYRITMNLPYPDVQQASTPQPSSSSTSRNTSRTQQTIKFDELNTASHFKAQAHSEESTAVDDQFLLRIWNLKDGDALDTFSNAQGD